MHRSFRNAWSGASRTCISLLCALALAASGTSVIEAHAEDPPTQDQIDQGRDIYDEFCATCHGRDMAVTGLVAFDLRKFPKNDRLRFHNSVLDGKPPAMPAWKGKLSDEDIDLLWAYVRGGP